MKIIFSIILFLFLNKLYSQENKTVKEGLAIQVGTGTMYSGLGVLTEYQVYYNNKIRLTPFVSAGAEFGSTDITGVWPGYCLGINMEYGKKHRWFLGPNFGSRGIGYETSKTELTNKHILVGPAFVTGYKGTSFSGLIWQINVGAAYMRNPVAINKKYFSGPSAGIGIGYKF